MRATLPVTLFSFFGIILFAVASAASLAAVPEGPEKAVQAFHAALASADRDAALRLLDPQVLIFEQGGAEMSRDEYASNHLDADIEFSRATSRKVSEKRSRVESDLGWVVTLSESSGTFRGREVSSRGAETMLLKKTAEGWRILHIPWSSHSVDAHRP